jgi:hypothetical protein
VIEQSNIILTVGIGMLIISVLLFAKYSSKPTFPIILALGGIFICAAHRVKADIPGVGNVEFERSVSVASDANSKAVLAQEAAIKAIGEELKGLRFEFTSYQKSANERLTRLDAPPIASPNAAKVSASAVQLEAKLEAVEIAREPVVRANKDLHRITKGFKF